MIWRLWFAISANSMGCARLPRMDKASREGKSFDQLNDQQRILQSFGLDPMRPGDLPREIPYLSPDIRHRGDFPMRTARHRTNHKQLRLCRSAARYRMALLVYINADGQLIGTDRAAQEKILQQRIARPAQVAKWACTIDHTGNCKPLGPLLSAIAYIDRDRAVLERGRLYLGSAYVQPSLCLHRLRG